MRWEDIDGAVGLSRPRLERRAMLACWCFPSSRLRSSTLNHALPLTLMCSLVAVARHINGWSRRKRQFDAKLEGVQPWVLHDLRRTARSLMSRAGVRPDISERVLGHVIKGVEGIYDRHAYTEEKAHALKALAGLIEKIVNPPARQCGVVARGEGAVMAAGV